MSDEKKYVVPEGMLRAAEESMRPIGGIPFAYIDRILEVAVRWLAENPIEPTKEQWSKLWTDTRSGGLHGGNYKMLSEWQRRMFLAPEPEVPELPTGTVCGCSKITCPHCEGVKKSEREEDLERDVYEHGKTTRDALMDEAVRVAPRDAVSVDVYNITGTLLGSRMIHPQRPETAQPEPDPAAVAVEKLLRSEGWVFSSDSRWRSAVGKIVAAVRGATSGAVAVAAPPSEPAPSPTPAPWNRGL